MDSIAARAGFAAASIVLAIAALALVRHGEVGRQSFKAFYCAGAAVKERSNPYLVEPMRSCERQIAPSAEPDGYVEPAPLPGYALVPFAILAMFPAKAAAAIFAILLVLAAVLSAYCLAPLLPAPRAAVLLALAPLTLLNVAFGEIPPFALLAICACAYFLSTERWLAAGIAVSAALIEPNVGLPAALAVFLFAPRTRIPIALCAVVLAGVSIAALGVSANVQYFTNALPLMAAAELNAADQYSLAHLLYAGGMSAGPAMLLSKIWFVVAMALGIALAGIFARRDRRPELLPLLPPAAVLLLGIYLHDIQMLLALPAALVLASRVRGETLRAVAAAACALLIAVWTQPLARATVILDAVGVAAGVYTLVGGPVGRRIAGSAVAVVAVILGLVLFQHVQPPPTADQLVTHEFHSASNEFGATAWARYLQSTPALLGQQVVRKIPTWLGLLVIMICALQLGVAAKPEDDSARRNEVTLSRS
jgi:Glycosyltransferase family 87